MGIEDERYSIAIFPFLKTSRAASIGGLVFRSTDDIEGLSPKRATSVDEIARMLFSQDDLHIRSASYAVIQQVDLSHSTPDLEQLRNVQAFVAYCYAVPRHEFGDLFLSSEHASMAVLTPGRVSAHLVRPDSHVDRVELSSDVVVDQFGEIEGYSGLYNFRHHFWVTKGSRLYGPMPHTTLNHAQNLSLDLGRAVAARADYRLLSELLRRPDTQTYSRVFTAVRWFNDANTAANDHEAAIVNLAIAFEALLGLPRDKKTERLTSAISLLLGRTPRLDIWVRQFYDARSWIVHQGYAEQMRFVATDSWKKNESSQGSPKTQDGSLYQSLLSYGRQIFQLCLGTVLTGADLSTSAGLEEKFVTNQERFEKICAILKDKTIPGRERLERIRPLVDATQQYRYVPETGLQIKTMIGAARLAAEILLKSGEDISRELSQHLKQLSTAEPSEDHLQELEALHGLNDAIPDGATWRPSGGEAGWDIVKVVWQEVFMHYFFLKERS